MSVEALPMYLEEECEVEAGLRHLSLVPQLVEFDDPSETTECYGPGEKPPDEIIDNVVSLNNYRNRNVDTGQPEIALDQALYEVELMLAHRYPDGSYPEEFNKDIFDNLVSDSYEMAVPHGLARFSFELQDGTYYWAGKSAEQVVQEGHLHYKHDFAHDRGYAEEDELRDVNENLTPGLVKHTISPQASRADATYEEAKSEGLHDRDLVRIQYLKTDEQGNVTHRVVESIQAFDVPLEAWTKMLQDPNNMYGKSVDIENPNSALSVLKTNNQTYTQEGALSDGPVAILRAVHPYIEDPEAYVSVAKQLEKFAVDQEALREVIERKTAERHYFLGQLVESIVEGTATRYVTDWVNSAKSELTEEAETLADSRRIPGGFSMDREFAALCSKINHRITGGRIGVLAETDHIIEALGDRVVQRIRREEEFFLHNNMSWEAQLSIMQETNREVAANKEMKVGGGCAASDADSFGKRGANGTSSSSRSSRSERNRSRSLENARKARENRASMPKHLDICRIPGCPSKENNRQVMCGPCNICMRRCQVMFDMGINPVRSSTVRETLTTSEDEASASKLLGVEASEQTAQELNVTYSEVANRQLKEAGNAISKPEPPIAGNSPKNENPDNITLLVAAA